MFAGSSPGIHPDYRTEAHRLGVECAQKGWGVIYGGGGSGLMAAVADGALSAGGFVEGVIPDSMVRREWAHRKLSELHVVETMHERKQRMHDRSDAFVALPGGIGTFDEICEALAWQKLEIHKKPVAVLNVNGFYNAFLAMLEEAVKEGFYSPFDCQRLWVVDNSTQLSERLSREGWPARTS